MKPNHQQRQGERTYWLDQPSNVRKVYLAVWALCGLLLLVEPLVHKHPEVAAEAWFGFHGWFGFVACVGLVLTAKWLRRLIKRPEDFYER